MDIIFEFEKTAEKKELIKLIISDEKGKKVVIEGICFISDTDNQNGLKMFINENSEFYKNCGINKEDFCNKKSLESKICIEIERIALNEGIKDATAEAISRKIVRNMMNYYVGNIEKCKKTIH